jgi:hypothetical protein
VAPVRPDARARVVVVIQDSAMDVVLPVVWAWARVLVVIRGSAIAVPLVQVEVRASEVARDLGVVERATLIETAVQWLRGGCGGGSFDPACSPCLLTCAGRGLGREALPACKSVAQRRPGGGLAGQWPA